MARKRKGTGVRSGRGEDGWDAGAVALAGAGVIGAGTLLYYYLKSGAGSEEDSPLMPDIIEKPLDAVVDALNSKVGKAWGDAALSILEKALEGVLPPSAVALVRIVHKAELLANDGKIKASEKKQWAEKRLEDEQRNRLH